MALGHDIKDVHFVGIGGYGMSALALILLQQGYRISGSDLKESPLTATLSARGAAVSIGHHPANLGSAQLVVYSTAVPSGNPELEEAGRRKLLLWHRSELLAALLNEADGIAIAGAHGKTTTTAMVALLLEAGGLDPTVVIGGILPVYGSNARLGSSRYLVAEADESDRSFTRYYPQIALVTGMEADHLEHYENDYASLIEAYSIFLEHLDPNGTAVLCAEDPALVEQGSRLKRRVVYYALSERLETDRPDYYAANLNLKGWGSTFDFYHRGALRVPAVHLSVPGRHNISNAVGALALADQLGINPADCAGALAAFKGVGRRFEIIGTVGDITVVDDYAHHPTEIKATLEAARPGSSRLICIFQPHRYSRMACFFEQFAAAFNNADQLFLHRVYSAGEEPIPGATSAALAELIHSQETVPVFHSADLAVLEEKAVEAARPGDLIITMGAGDITGAAPRIVTRLQEKARRS